MCNVKELIDKLIHRLQMQLSSKQDFRAMKLRKWDGVYLQPVASTINTLAGALYKVFCASPDQARKEMREACFDYLSLGGIFSEGPIALLSGLNPRPLSLFMHFFAVAIYGMGRLLLPFPSPKRAWLGARLISVRLHPHCNTYFSLLSFSCR